MVAEEMQAPESSPAPTHSGEYPIPSQAKPDLKLVVDSVAPEEEAVFSSRSTMLDINETAPQSGETIVTAAREQAPESTPVVEAQRTVISAKAHQLMESFQDDRLASDDIDVAFKAVDDHAAYQAKMVKELEHDVLDRERERQHFELTRKGRGFFTKLKDFASNVWSGSTPEEAARGVQGTGGIRGMFMGQQQRMESMIKRAGIDPQELKKVSDLKTSVPVKSEPDAEYPLPMRKIFGEKKEPMIKGPRDAEYPLPMKSIFGSKQETFVPSQPDAEYPLPMQPSIVASIGNGISKFLGSIRNGISSFFKNKTVRKVAVAGAVAGGTLIAGASSCGKGCTHPWHIDMPPVASNSASNGDGGAAPSDTAQTVPSSAPTAVVSNDPAPVAPAPTVTPLDKEEKKETKKAEVKTAPKNAKVSHLPKPSVVAQKPEPKVEQPKPGEAKECADSTKAADLDKCLVKAEDALRLRASLYEQLEEQKKALEKVYAPIANGPAYVSMNPYKTDRQPITFVEANTVGSPSNDPLDPSNTKASSAEKNPIAEMNAENKKIVEDALAKAKTMIEGAKTPKDFENAVAFMKSISDRIDSLTAERGKQIASNLDAANGINAQFAKDKITDIEKHSGKKVDVTVDDTKVATKGGETITHSTINIPASRRLLDGSEADMLAPTLGNDPDQVIASVQKKLEYYRGLIQFNRSLDDVRVKQRPASARMAEAARVGSFNAPQKGGTFSGRHVAAAK